MNVTGSGGPVVGALGYGAMGPRCNLDCGGRVLMEVKRNKVPVCYTMSVHIKDP